MAPGFLIGVDGGGSGTRLVLCDAAGKPLARSSAGPSGLGLGIEPAWQAIHEALARAFADAGLAGAPATQCAIGLGLAGVHNPAWAAAFLDAAPPFAAIELATDGFTTLLGAHGGKPGVIVAIGTGTVGEAWFGGEDKRTASGWGFPSGDEGSGAWIGLRAAQLAQKVLDGRSQSSPLARAVIAQLGGNIEQAFKWFGQAKQTTYAQLCPLVLENAPLDAAAATILRAAGEEIAQVAHALDPAASLPLALCGGLADALRPWLPAELLNRAQPPLGDSVMGALHLIRGHI
ncbi:BadF/BadG/BcrA/BcrD ATPase family protein [Chitinimonas sp.]|uniref:BadF/BadG/BcrA/BcrD ATPase family protein n=1 Tax=Chitinimonas sp. TaxID=1934313 RepID=UPI0035AFE67E